MIARFILICPLDTSSRRGSEEELVTDDSFWEFIDKSNYPPKEWESKESGGIVEDEEDESTTEEKDNENEDDDYDYDGNDEDD